MVIENIQDNNMGKRGITTRQYFFEIKPFTKKNKNRLKYLITECHLNSRQKVDNNSLFIVKIVFFFKKDIEKIDLDNLAKPVLDAFTGIIYGDDGQIIKLELEKRNNEIIDGMSITIKSKKV